MLNYFYDLKSTYSLFLVISKKMAIQRSVLSLKCSPNIRNDNCPALSISQNGSDVQEAPHLLNQEKVCHFEPIEKLDCGMFQ